MATGSYENTKRWMEKYPERSKESKKRWLLKNKEKMKSYIRDWKLKKRYGISNEQFLSILAEQDGRCRICNRNKYELGSTHLVVDHNHLTGKVRGILCSKCNVAIGLLGDDSPTAYRASKYLELTN